MFLLVETAGIGAGAGYDRIGPRFFPYVVTAGLIALGVWHAISSWRDRRASGPPRPTSELNWISLGLLGLSFLLSLALLESMGFVVASSAQFWLVSRAFDSRRPLRDAVAAVLVATSVYVVFSRGLGLALPPGFFDGVR
jgi:putative tricarboxylic transport membrane protein